MLPLAKILEALISSPYDPQFYWIYLMLFSTLLPSLVHVLGGLVGLVLACLLWVFESAKSAQEFAKDSRLEDVTKQTKLTTWYPAGAATGATALVAVVYIGGSAMPYVAAGVIWFAKLLFATALWTASFFPA